MNTVPRIVVGVDGFESSKAALRLGDPPGQADRGGGGRGDDLADLAGFRARAGRQLFRRCAGRWWLWRGGAGL